jgi:nicotinamidase-related amidase
MTTPHLDIQATHVAGSTPYAWPWNGDLTPSGTAILVVEPAASGPELSDGFVDAVVGVVAAARAAEITVIRVITAAPPYSTAAAGHHPLPVEVDYTVTAVGIDGFYGSALDALVRTARIERFVLVGAGLETCVHSTMRSANDRGYECLLVIDAAIPYSEELVEPSVSMIEMSGGIFGAVAHSAAVIDAITKPRGEN